MISLLASCCRRNSPMSLPCPSGSVTTVWIATCRLQTLRGLFFMILRAIRCSLQQLRCPCKLPLGVHLISVVLQSCALSLGRPSPRLPICLRTSWKRANASTTLTLAFVCKREWQTWRGCSQHSIPSRPLLCYFLRHCLQCFLIRIALMLNIAQQSTKFSRPSRLPAMIQWLPVDRAFSDVDLVTHILFNSCCKMTSEAHRVCITYMFVYLCIRELLLKLCCNRNFGTNAFCLTIHCSVQPAYSTIASAWLEARCICFVGHDCAFAWLRWPDSD